MRPLLKLAFTTTILALIENCFASSTFENKVETGAYSVGQRVICMSDSGYLITGLSESSFQSSIACRLNSVGDTLWLKKFGSNDFSLEAVESNGSGYLIVGATQNGAGDQSSVVWKIDTNGNLQWAKIITPDTLGYSVFTSIKKVGNNYLIGGFADFGNIVGSGGWGNTLVMIDSSGAILWSKMFWIDSEYYSILSMKLTSDSNILVTGTAGANYAMKLDSSGNLIWAKNYSDGMFTSVEEINSSYYFCGFNSDFECIIAKTDLNGIVDWTKAYMDMVDPMQICRNYSGGLSIATTLNGLTGSQSCVLEVDTFGVPTKLSSFNSASDDLGADIKQTLDGGFIFCLQKDVGTNDAIGIVKADSAMHTGCEINNSLPATFNLSLQGINFTPQILTSFFSQSISLVIESGGVLSSICNSSGLGEISNPEILFYPTISNGQFHVRSNKKAILIIFNSLGIKIKECTINGTHEIELHTAGKGIYFYKILFDGTNEIESGKFIVN